MDSKKANKYLKWKNKVNLDKGLEKVINWQLANKKVLKKLKIQYMHKA